MTKLKTILHVTAAIVALQLTCAAKTPKFTGKMVAYDPFLHASKPSTMQSNKEVIILETPNHKKKYVKLVFISFGTKQLDEKYFDGSTPITVEALRDEECDERFPRYVTQVSLDQGAGSYLLTDAFKASPPPHLKKLECYDATAKK
jgi:hypothetical protein